MAFPRGIGDNIERILFEVIKTMGGFSDRLVVNKGVRVDTWCIPIAAMKGQLDPELQEQLRNEQPDEAF